MTWCQTRFSLWATLFAIVFLHILLFLCNVVYMLIQYIRKFPSIATENKKFKIILFGIMSFWKLFYQFFLNSKRSVSVKKVSRYKMLSWCLTISSVAQLQAAMDFLHGHAVLLNFEVLSSNQRNAPCLYLEMLLSTVCPVI